MRRWPGRLAVVLVAVALSFCHGAFGYAHQSSLPEAHGSHAVHAAGVQQPSSAPDTDEGHAKDAYFAILLALLFGTFLPLVGGVSAGAKLAFPKVSGPYRGPGILPPPRGPALPILQVFRL